MVRFFFLFIFATSSTSSLLQQALISLSTVIATQNALHAYAMNKFAYSKKAKKKIKKKIASAFNDDDNRRKYRSAPCIGRAGNDSITQGYIKDAVALSGNGKYVAVGHPGGRSSANAWAAASSSSSTNREEENEPFVQVFEYIASTGTSGVNNNIGSGDFVQRGQDIKLSQLKEIEESVDTATTTPTPIEAPNTTSDESVSNNQMNDNIHEDGFASTVALSNQGNVLAIAAPFYPTTPTSSAERHAGKIWVYDFDSITQQWKIRSDEADILKGSSGWDRLGETLSLSDDGMTLAAGSPMNDVLLAQQTKASASNTTRAAENSTEENGGMSPTFKSNMGYVKLFSYTSFEASWVNSAIFRGNYAEDNFGSSIDLSSSGNVIAVGSSGNAGSTESSARVQIFEKNFTSGSWQPRGKAIQGLSAQEALQKVSISDDGTIVAIGAPNYSQNKGIVRTYQYNGLGWERRRAFGGDDSDYIVVGNMNDDQTGMAVALSGDGEMMAVGSPANAGDGAGVVRVYSWKDGWGFFDSSSDDDGEEGTGWVQFGPDLKFLEGGGDVVQISGDGTTVITTVGDTDYRSVHAYRLVEIENSWGVCDSPFETQSEWLRRRASSSGRVVPRYLQGMVVLFMMYACCL